MAAELQQACEAGNIEEVKRLISKKKVNLNATDKRGWTALHCAANKASEKENYGNPAFLTICQMLLKVHPCICASATCADHPTGGRRSYNSIQPTITKYATSLRRKACPKR